MAKNNSMIQEFITDAFDYYTILEENSINHSVNRYLLEHIANGFVKYGSVENFIKNIDKWIRSLVKIYPELGFDHKSNQIHAVVDLQDQLIIIDEELKDDLSEIIRVQSQYGLLIKYKPKNSDKSITTTLALFFEHISAFYPVIKDRYKGLGSSDAKVSREVIMDPNTRRIIRVKMDDLDTDRRLGILVGKSKDEVNARKELLLNFKFTKDMIDN